MMAIPATVAAALIFAFAIESRWIGYVLTALVWAFITSLLAVSIETADNGYMLFDEAGTAFWVIHVVGLAGALALVWLIRTLRTGQPRLL